MNTTCLLVMRAVLLVIGGLLFARASFGIDIDGRPAPMPIRVTRQADNPMMITGVVRSTAGSPIKGARIALLAAIPDFFVPPLGSVSLAETVSDDHGRFEIETGGVPQLQRKYHWLVAFHSDCGMASIRLPDGPREHGLEIQLPPARVFSARVVSPEGTNVSSATVRLLSWSHDAQKADLKNSDHINAWPEPVLTDNAGQFSIRGIPSAASHVRLLVAVSHPEHGDQEVPIILDGDGKSTDKTRVLQLQPSVTVEGVVLARDTKRPLAGVWLQVVLTDTEQTGDLHYLGKVVFGDERGRFRCRVARKSRLVIYAYPPTNSGYPAWVHSNREVPRDKDVRKVRIEVPRGVLIRGTAVEQESGRPVPGASVTYWVQRGKRQRHPQVSRHDAHMTYWASEERPIVTDGDGVFFASVLPGPGYLLVKAPSQDFISKNLTHGEVLGQNPGGFFFSVEAAKKISPSYGVDKVDTAIELRRGQSVDLLVHNSDGTAVKSALLLDPHYTQMRDTYDSSHRQLPVWNGRTTVRGCDPSSPRTVYILDVSRNEGATVDLQPIDIERGQRTVQLARCGCAEVKVLRRDGTPLSNQSIKSKDLLLQTYLVHHAAAVGEEYGTSAIKSQIRVDWVIDRFHRQVYWGLQTDRHGVVRLPGLISGAQHQVVQFSPVYREYPPFTVPEDASDCATVARIVETVEDR